MRTPGTCISLLGGSWDNRRRHVGRDWTVVGGCAYIKTARRYKVVLTMKMIVYLLQSTVPVHWHAVDLLKCKL
ncbi:hypothetical protein AHF37_09243 [Paragonimus kellicotti]|nr:hypothetical protein AHF37_09243 [Paragonimus kellicotti]